MGAIKLTYLDENTNQHLQYLPFGESFIDQRATGHDIRYKFTGKERDSETGFDYFGARYYDSDLSVWLSVDPMSDKHPDYSPYSYVYNSPLNLVDPWGEDSIQLHRDGTTNIIATTKDDFDVYVATDKNGNLDKNTSHNIDKKDYKSKTSTCEQNDGYIDAYGQYEVRGDDKATELFEFFVDNTDVEWSHGKFGNAGEKALNLLTTSHDVGSEAGMSHALTYRFLHGYKIREMIHNHPSGNGTPSGEDGDLGFMKQLNSYYKYNNEIKYKIYTNKYRKRYSEYGKYGTYDTFMMIIFDL